MSFYNINTLNTDAATDAATDTAKSHVMKALSTWEPPCPSRFHDLDRALENPLASDWFTGGPPGWRHSKRLRGLPGRRLQSAGGRWY